MHIVAKEIWIGRPAPAHDPALDVSSVEGRHGRMGRRIAIAGLLITALVNALHYSRKIVLDYPLLPGHPEALRDLARAATWADGWMGLIALIGAIGLWLRRDWGALFGIVAAAALIHMGFLDVAFFAQHGMYAHLDVEMAEMIVVDLWAFGMGSFLIVFLWRQATSRSA
jgi:hypothetical protein